MARIVRYRVQTVDLAEAGGCGVIVMVVSVDFQRSVLEQLDGLGMVTPRRMFLAVGLFCGDWIFALIARDEDRTCILWARKSVAAAKLAAISQCHTGAREGGTGIPVGRWRRPAGGLFRF